MFDKIAIICVGVSILINIIRLCVAEEMKEITKAGFLVVAHTLLFMVVTT